MYFECVFVALGIQHAMLDTYTRRKKFFAVLGDFASTFCLVLVK